MAVMTVEVQVVVVVMTMMVEVVVVVVTMMVEVVVVNGNGSTGGGGDGNDSTGGGGGDDSGGDGNGGTGGGGDDNGSTGGHEEEYDGSSDDNASIVNCGGSDDNGVTFGGHEDDGCDSDFSDNHGNGDTYFALPTPHSSEDRGTHPLGISAIFLYFPCASSRSPPGRSKAQISFPFIDSLSFFTRDLLPAPSSQHGYH